MQLATLPHTKACRYSAFVETIRRLDHAVRQLDAELVELNSVPVSTGIWRELLQRKLLPQTRLPEVIVVAVAGGTNIGKSAIFNTLAGKQASLVSPLASGTKHPVCLVPSRWADERLLSELFDDFQIDRWRSPVEATVDTPQHRLLWLEASDLPDRLMLLDTPDVDSTSQVNWDRAKAILHAADVLLAVLTQQKYNDAAVRSFFRQAVEADKPMFLLFNQVDLEGDRDSWPHWFKQFCESTGAAPEATYVIPYNREAANSCRLSFFVIDPSTGDCASSPTDLRHQLCEIEFDRIKLRTMRGAWQKVADQCDGLPAYLNQIRHTATEYREAVTAINNSVPRIIPMLPTDLFRQEMFQWWDSRRNVITRTINKVYRWVFSLPKTLIRQTRSQPNISADVTTDDSTRKYQLAEWQEIERCVESLFDELERLASVGNAVIRPRLERLLAGGRRNDLLSRLKKEHSNSTPVDADFRRFIHSELDELAKSHPKLFTTLKTIDNLFALARPCITVALFWTGTHLVGEVGTQTIGHVMTETVVTVVTAGGGETAIATAGLGIKEAATQMMRRLEIRYAENRARWLGEFLRRELFSDLFNELFRGASLPDHSAFREIEQCLAFALSGSSDTEEPPAVC